MDHFTKEDLQRLTEHDGPGLSLFLPTERAGREVQQNHIRFKNLVSQAKSAIEENHELHGQLKKLVEWEEDNDFWQHQSDGLAVFVSKDEILKWRLPISFESHWTLNSYFETRPLCQYVQNDGQYYLLAVSQNKIRLFRGSQAGLQEQTPDELPKDLRSALNIDEYVSSLQHHSGNSASREAIFHGHGGSDADVKKQQELQQYFHHINRALNSYFGTERTPLVFAGVEYLFPIFKETCDYNQLLNEPVTGNPDHLSADQLHEKAWPTVTSHFQQQHQDEMEAFQVAKSRNQATEDLSEICRLAAEGAIQRLLLSDSQQDSTESDTAKSGEKQDLNRAIVDTLKNGGEIYVIDQQQTSAAAMAVLRYPLTETSSVS